MSYKAIRPMLVKLLFCLWISSWCVACGATTEVGKATQPAPSLTQSSPVSTLPPAPTHAGIKDETSQVKPPLQQLTLADMPVTAYIPPPLPGQSSPPQQVLFALHGMYDRGSRFSGIILPFAIKNHLIMLAPTFSYSVNFKDPNVVGAEDIKLTAKLNQMVVDFEALTHQNIKNQLLLYGFSRGAQLAHHYAIFYPKQVLGIAVLSGGAYTLPATQLDNKPLPFPFGVSNLNNYLGQPFDLADFSRVPFCVEVGALDTDTRQVARPYDPYIGINRVERGQNFYNALLRDGVEAEFNTIPMTGHTDNLAMETVAEKFFQKLLPQTLR